MFDYPQVTTRFLRQNEHFIISEEQELPLVIEAKDTKNLDFLQELLAAHSKQIIQDMAQYGAVLLRGFDINTDKDFENTVLKIPEFKGISDAFMSENGRTHVDDLQFVLHTNSVYKTGGTLYLGGFHTENYYSPDVPSYICFCCFKPSNLGGETGLINTQKLYAHLNSSLKEKLEQNSYFVGQWSFAEIEQRYQICPENIYKIAQYFNLPVGEAGGKQFILMHKPIVFEHPLNKQKALQINLFELPTLNRELRKCFAKDYPGKTWFWHRFFWKLPNFLFNTVEFLAVICISLVHSPKNSYQILRNKISNIKIKKQLASTKKVGTCFNKQEVKDLAQLMRTHYSSCLWQKGDILLVDNKKVMHAGMPGMGDRLVRALICNPIEMSYSSLDKGCLVAKDRTLESIGNYMVASKSVIEEDIFAGCSTKGQM